MNTDRLASVWGLLATDTELSRYVTPADKAEFKRRVEAEGIEFLTTVLPRLDKALLSAFRTNKFECPVGFKKAKDCAYPAFLRNAWREVFKEDGTLRWYDTAAKLCTDDWNIVPFDQSKAHFEKVDFVDGKPVWTLQPKQMSIVDTSITRCPEQSGAAACIRQLTTVFYKLETPYSDEKICNVLDAFKATERDLRDLDLRDRVYIKSTRCLRSTLLNRARKLIGRLLSNVNPLDILPRHSSGATACKTKPHERWELPPRFVERLDDVYSYREYFHSGHMSLSDNWEDIMEWSGAPVEPAARMTFVPKDSRGPRGISCEPREFMYIQQGIMTLLYDTYDRFPVIKRMLSCRDQSVNQEMAYYGSLWGNYASLDLNEASDRVSLQLVEALFPSNWVRALKACRSTKTVLPAHTRCGVKIPADEMELLKFAPMGSALCFPVEALVFWSLSIAAMNPTDRFINGLFGDTLSTEERMCLTVFGDDIVCRLQHVDAIIETLESVGLRVNQDKSYWSGPFRESCGSDYYHGTLITPIRVKHPIDKENDEYTLFRSADTLQGIINRYGEYSPNVAKGCQALFREWFGVPIPLFSSARMFRKAGDRWTGLILTDDYWEHCADSSLICTVRPLKKRERMGRSIDRPSIRDRVRVIKHRYHSDYQVMQIRVLCEVASEYEVDQHNWSYVLKALLVGSGPGMVHVPDEEVRTITGKFALAKRNRYKYGWLEV